MNRILLDLNNQTIYLPCNITCTYYYEQHMIYASSYSAVVLVEFGSRLTIMIDVFAVLYCSVGHVHDRNVALERDLSMKHLQACIYAGVNVYGSIRENGPSQVSSSLNMYWHTVWICMIEHTCTCIRYTLHHIMRQFSHQTETFLMHIPKILTCSNTFSM